MYINKISVYQNNVYGKRFTVKKNQEISFQGVKGALTGGVASCIITMGWLNVSQAKVKNAIGPLLASTIIGVYCGSKLEDKNNNDDDNNNGFNQRMRRI